VLADLGCDVVPVDLAGIDLAEHVGWQIMAAECASYHEITFDRLGDYDHVFAERLTWSQFITGVDYLAAQRYRSVVQRGMSEAFGAVDMLLTPATPTTAPRFDDMLVDLGGERVEWLEVAARCTFPFNVTGMPALVIPAGVDHHGLPVAIQLAARPFDDATCLRVGHAFQQVTEHHRRVRGLTAAVTA
jgi:aspartyl-tRNA(Asn)/glutamyl-tRNA(Gln) amidotransferase subunit A